MPSHQPSEPYVETGSAADHGHGRSCEPEHPLLATDVPYRCLTRRDFVVALGLFALAGTLILAFFMREPLYSDDSSYFEFASRFGAEDAVPWSANQYRLAFVLSLVAAQSVFGYSASAAAVVAVGYSAALVAVVFLLGRQLFPLPVAVAGALILLSSPIFLGEAALTMIDWPALFWLVLGLVLLLPALTAGPLRRRLPLAVAAGTALFLTVWTKEAMVPMLIISPAGLLVVRRDRRSIELGIVAAATAALLAVVELGLNAWLFGDPLARVQAITGGHMGGATGGWVDSGLVEADLTWLDLALRYPQLFGATTHGQLLLVAGALGLIGASLLRSRELVFLCVLVLTGGSFVAFAPGSLDPLVPLLRTKERYIAVILPFVALLIPAVTWAFAARLHRGSTGSSPHGIASVLVVATGLAFVGIGEEWGKGYYVRNGTDPMRQTAMAAEALVDTSGHELGRVVSDWRTLRVVRMYLPTGVEAPLVPVDQHSRWEMDNAHHFLPGDLVVLNRRRLEGNERWYGELPDVLRQPPNNWLPVAHSPWNRTTVYYVVDLDGATHETPDEIGALVHAYPFDEDAGDVRVVDADANRFELDAAADVRIVLGEGRYHQPPASQDEALTLSEEGSYLLGWTMSTGPYVSIDDVRVVTFASSGSVLVHEPLMPTAQGEGLRFAGWVHAKTAKSTAFRLFGRVSGDGWVQVTDATIDGPFMLPEPLSDAREQEEIR